MSNPFVARAALAVAALIVAASTAAAQPPAPAIGAAPAATATVSQLAFIAGPWTGTLGDRTIEQHWSAPLGDSMVAMYRNVRDGKAGLYELLVIEQEGTGVALRIKHFAPGPGLVGRQAKDEAVNHRLVRVEGETAVFEGTGENPTRVTFLRKGPDALTITVERMRDGAIVATDFPYTRLR